MEQNLKEKTGKTLVEWKSLLAQQAFTKHGECMNFLKKDHGITHGFANFISLKFRESDAESINDDQLLTVQYQGKEQLKTIYDYLHHHILEFGDDIQVIPKKAAVSFKVKRQFALIQPSTKKRIDLGLKFNDKAYQGALENSGPFGVMCTHRVQLTAIEQVTDEVIAWLSEAYQEAK